ncbi:anti-sigma factor [Bacteroidia bacterium]|nr:anti-sigma factor [Bacteroidia bacterium]GHU75925.1 anti-sigma factor [Bacteroidia bacterium]
MDKELLQRYVEGRVSNADIETVVAWLDADESNVREMMTLHKLNDIALLNPTKYQKAVSLKKRQLPLRKLALELAKIAAIFCIAAVGMYLIQNNQSVAESPIANQTLYVPAGQRAELTLPDSTRIWLNAQSRLTYPTRFADGYREILLDGEAYFEVKHNKEQPFIVKTKAVDIQVLGTEFNVIAYSANPAVEIALLRGSIELKPAGMKQSYLMTANELVRWKEGKFFTSQINDYDYFRWKEGLICFNNETVGSIIDKLQLYFDVKINVNKDSLLKQRYTGKFRTKDGVEQVLKVLQLEHRFTYIKDNEQNVITIK